MDSIQIEILADGTVSIKTTGISQVNHISADALLDMIEDELGTVKSTAKNEHVFWKDKAVQKGGKIVKAS